MRIISFAWTTPALLAGVKCVTRRDWQDRYALSFEKGERCQAWDKSPRTGQGKRVGTIELTASPVKESTRNIPGEDWVNEGFEYLAATGTYEESERAERIWTDWRGAPRCLWVIRFRLVSP